MGAHQLYVVSRSREGSTGSIVTGLIRGLTWGRIEENSTSKTLVSGDREVLRRPELSFGFGEARYQVEKYL